MANNRLKPKTAGTPPRVKTLQYVPAKVGERRFPGLQRKFAKAEALLSENTPESRKRYKEMSQHSYGRDRININGVWNGTGSKPRKRKVNKWCRVPRGIAKM